MSDEEWGDDAGWGDEEETGSTGGGDDGWGDDGGDGDGGWGDDAGGDEWGDVGDPLGGDEELSPELMIENTFYQADDVRLESPADALTQFQKVIELSGDVPELNDETLSFVFKSFQNIVLIQLQLEQNAAMVESYKRLLEYIPKVTRNEAQNAINNVLQEVGESSDTEFVSTIYGETSKTLASMPNQERLWFKVNMKFCELSYERGDFAACEDGLQALLASCRTPEGKDDMSKGAELLEIYALESRMSMAANDTKKLKALYEKTKDLEAAVRDPKSQSVIRECWGQMFGDIGQWQRAYGDFYNAFISYQEIGDRYKSRKCLRYLVIANVLSGKESNPFDDQAIKPYERDPEIKAIVDLRKANEECDVKKFNKALDEILKDGDVFIAKHLKVMVRSFQGKAILQIVKSYRRVRLDFLAKTLRITVPEVEELLVQLILDGDLVGRIDQVKGLLDLGTSRGGGARYQALERWGSTVSHLIGALPTPSGVR